ncbi:MAG TPA: hypothetical protein VHO69_09370 [Phototrophicaceae bacterium]|nr:hypothetical protein [Phototrophicaceae bacterium]
MEVKVFEIKEYMIIWRQLELMNFNGVTVRVRAIVRCTGGEYSMDIYFIDDDSTVPDPMYDVTANKGYMFLNIRDIMAFVDILRNERPLYGHLRGDRPEWMSVTTAKEPVGEGEG